MAVETEVRPQLFHLRTPLLKEGRLDTVVAKTREMTVTMKCYAEGGENELHTHVAEDHIFVVLDGEARFFGKEGETSVLGRNQGILVPAGWYYRFESCGDRPLVMLRVGAGDGAARVNIDGQPMHGLSAENKYVPPVPIEGAFYE